MIWAKCIILINSSNLKHYENEIIEFICLDWWVNSNSDYFNLFYFKFDLIKSLFDWDKELRQISGLLQQAN